MIVMVPWQAEVAKGIGSSLSPPLRNAKMLCRKLFFLFFGCLLYRKVLLGKYTRKTHGPN